MMRNTSIHQLAEKCREESEKFRQGQASDGRPCFALFRRAIVDGDQQAWNAICDQYRPLVVHWLGVGNGEVEVDDLVNVAFEKFLRAVAPSRFDRQFGHLGEILRLFHDCARSAAIDDWRRRKRREQGLEEMAEQLRAESEEVSVEERALTGVALDELYRRCRTLLKDEQERLAFRLSSGSFAPSGDATSDYGPLGRWEAPFCPGRGAGGGLRVRGVRRLRRAGGDVWTPTL
nr:hypothetical protein [Anaerolineae bacterium]